MSKKIGLVHATLNAVQPMNDAFREYAPDVTILNFLDEGLISEVNKTGGVTPALVRRLGDLIEKAEESDVDGILLTCSTFTPVVPKLAEFFKKPVVSADYSMLEEAVSSGSRIGVIATVLAAGPVTEQLLKDIAAERGKEIEVQISILPEAFKALSSGNAQLHDELIGRKIQEFSVSCDVIVLAQISMARASKAVPNAAARVLTSPEISIQTIMGLLG